MIDLTNRRLVIAHNPHSSRAKLVEQQVFRRLESAGYDYAAIEVKQASLEDNVARLKTEFKAGDVVIAAAGDGSAHAIAHSVMASGKEDITLGFLGFGNFNDLPHVFNSKKAERDPVGLLETAHETSVYPLELVVDKKPLRKALLYATIGWTAQAAGQFDNPKVRRAVKNGQAGVIRSVWRLGWYYLSSRRRSVLPPFQLNGQTHDKTTDILCMNGPSLARLFRVGRSYVGEDRFLFRVLDVRGLVKNTPFLLSGLIGRIKGSEETKLSLRFAKGSTVPIQCDGEVVPLEGIRQITVTKAKMPLRVLTNR